MLISNQKKLKLSHLMNAKSKKNSKIDGLESQKSTQNFLCKKILSFDFLQKATLPNRHSKVKNYLKKRGNCSVNLF